MAEVGGLTGLLGWVILGLILSYEVIRLLRETLPHDQSMIKARLWLSKYNEQHIIKGYKKRFGVDCLTAINDLGELGISTRTGLPLCASKEQRVLTCFADKVR